MNNEIIWTPVLDKKKNTSLYKFIEHINLNYKIEIDNFESLHKWSIENRSYFWEEVWNFFNMMILWTPGIP